MYISSTVYNIIISMTRCIHSIIHYRLRKNYTECFDQVIRSVGRVPRHCSVKSNSEPVVRLTHEQTAVGGARQ